MPSVAAENKGAAFFKYDESKLKELSAIRDQDEYINTARGYIEELERLLQADSTANPFAGEKGWDDDSLITEVRGMQMEKK